MPFVQKIILIFIIFTPITVFADSFKLESGTERNMLIELYTSEGCSSCPPAEKHLNSYKKNKNLWKNFIPVAFHVDYWDYIGWKDRFARKAFGQRQSTYAKLFNLRTVYTPAFLLNGRSWRPGFFSTQPEIKSETAGNLKIEITNNQLTATYDSPDKGPLHLNIAILGMDLHSEITRGENAGNKAMHEFVVSGYKSVLSNTSNWRTRLPELHVKGVAEKAVAVWVSEPSSPEPLQVVGGYFNP